MKIGNWFPPLAGLLGVAILIVNCGDGPVFIRVNDCDSKSPIICPPVTPSPTPTVTPTPTPVPEPTFTITCSDLDTHLVQAGETISLSIFSAVFIEPSLTPKNWYAAKPERVLELLEKEGKLAYAPTDFEPDILTFTSTINEETGEAAIRSLFITVVPQGSGLCDD